MEEILKNQRQMLIYLLEMVINFLLIAVLYEFNFKILINRSSEIFYFSGFISGIIFWNISNKLHVYFEKWSNKIIKM